MAGPRLFWLTESDRVTVSLEGVSTLLPRDEMAIHLTKSLRCQIGDRFSFCHPDAGSVFGGEVIHLAPLSIVLTPAAVGSPRLSFSGECRFSLAIAPLKGDVLAEILSQAVMCGIDRLFWLSTDRGIVRWDSSDYHKKKGRMEAIVREKSQLSGRTDRMHLDGPVSLSALIDDPEKSLLFFDESVAGWGDSVPWWESLPPLALKNEKPHELVAMIGPEGGWSDRERHLLEMAPRDRILQGSLGPLILSAEAAILAISSLLGLAGGYYRNRLYGDGHVASLKNR